MLRLTVIEQTLEEAEIKVEGWVKSAKVEFLERKVILCFQQYRRLVLDLAGVRFIDAEGIALLRRWVNRGVVLRNSSYFVQNLLQAHGLELDPSEQSAEIERDG